jgi:hypothetical protein
MKVWITKNALTKGIRETEVEVDKSNGNYVYEIVNGEENLYFGLDWHETEEQAKIRANAMLQSKIDSLKRQIRVLEKLSF